MPREPMPDRPPAPGASSPDAEARSRAFQGQALSLGVTLAVGMALFAGGGYWLDQRQGGGYAWTLAGMFLGLLFGTYEVWKLVRLLEGPKEEATPDRRPPPAPSPPAGEGRGEGCLKDTNR